MGVAPAFGASETCSVPPAAIVADVLPLGTVCPLAVVNALQLTSTVPVAAVPSAWYTVSETSVVAIVPCAIATTVNNANSPGIARKIKFTSVHPLDFQCIAILLNLNPVPVVVICLHHPGR